MKLNKIISAIAAVAMLSTSLVSVYAEDKIVTRENGNGILVIDSIPTLEDMLERTPSVSIVVDENKIASKSALKSVSSTSFSNKWNEELYDFYKVTATFSNLGDLANGYACDESDEFTDRMIAGIANLSISINTDKILLAGGSTKLDGFKASVGVKASGDQTNAALDFTDLENPYPVYDEDEENATIVEDAEVTLVFAVAIEAGTSASIVADQITSYVMYVNGADTDFIDLTVTDNLTFGKVAGDEGDEGEEVTEVVMGNKYDLRSAGGYAWDVVIKNFDSEKTYATIFKDGEETRTVGDNELTVDAYAEADGSDLEFAVLMKTSRANVTLNIEVQ